MRNFVKNFSRFGWKFEFILNNNTEISKWLFYFFDNNFLEIYNYIDNNMSNINKRDHHNINKIFILYGDMINHIWYDKSTKRYKIYIWLYNIAFEDSLKIIKKCKDILWIKKKYFLEKDFDKFDCIWFDIQAWKIDMKIYELVRVGVNLGELPSYINKKEIKEIGYLKNFSWRKKKFFRFWLYQDIKLFSDDFDISWIIDFEINTLVKSSLQNKIKYYCTEWDKKELYFI